MCFSLSASLPPLLPLSLSLQGMVPDCEKVKSTVLDDVISQVAEWQEHSSALEPSKLKLKESAWAEYDPCFTHVGEKTHQFALETRPKQSNITRAMCPDFNIIPAHPAFQAVRTCALSDPLLLTLVRDLFYANMIDRIAPMSAGAGLCTDDATATHPQYPYHMLHKEWTLRCSAAVFSKTLQLLTLMVHNLFRLKNEPNEEESVPCFLAGVNEAERLESQSRVPSVQERQDSFESFLLTPGRLVLACPGGGQRRDQGDREFGKARSRSSSSSSSTSGGEGNVASSSPNLTSEEHTMEEFGIPTTMNFDDLFPLQQLQFPPAHSVVPASKGKEEKEMEEEGEGEEEEEEEAGCVRLPPLLNTIMDIYDSLSSTGTDDDLFNKQSLFWIIGKLELTLSARCGEVIQQRMKQELHEKRRLEMKEKREKAQERAMSAMKKNAAAFIAHLEKEVKTRFTGCSSCLLVFIMTCWCSS